MKRHLSKPSSRRSEKLGKVCIMSVRTKDDECTEAGKEYIKGCVNPRGCGCTACD